MRAGPGSRTGSRGSRRSSRTSPPRRASLASTVDHDPATLARARGAPRRDPSPAAPVRRRRGGGHRAWHAIVGRGGAAARARGRAGTPRRGRRAAAAGGRGRRGEALDPAGDDRDRARGAVGAVLAELGFPAEAFGVALGRRPAARDDPAVEVDGDAVAFDATGIDTVVFTFRPNAGEPARPLARIASGGELSRVALAVKQVLAEIDETPTLVFDEIDTGIGGRSADPVGAQPVVARARPPGAVRHAPAADRRVRRRPLPDRQGGAGRSHRDRGGAASTAPSARRSWPR